MAATYPIRRLADSTIGAGWLIRRLADRNGKRFVVCLIKLSKKKPVKLMTGFLNIDGGDLLSHNKCSTIGAGWLNFSVRNGKRWT